MPSSGPAFERAPTSIGRRPIERANSATVSLASAAATTFASGISAWASSAEDPAGGGVCRRGPPNVSGTTVETTTLSRQPSRTSGSVAARPSAGSAMTTTVPRRAASTLDSPMIGSLCVSWRSSAAFDLARSGSREPMMIEWPTIAHRVASPAPSLPVPPRIAMFIRAASSEKIARGLAHERLRALLGGRQREPPHDRRRDPVELAHDGLRGPGELVGQRENSGLQRPAGRIALTEVAAEGREAGDADRDVREPLAPGAPERVGDDDAHVDAGQHAHAVAHLARRAVRVLGKQRHRVGVDGGPVPAGVRADPAVMRLGDDHALGHAHDAPRLAQDDLDERWLLAERWGHRDGDRRRLDVAELHDPAFGLRHDLL